MRLFATLFLFLSVLSLVVSQIRAAMSSEVHDVAVTNVTVSPTEVVASETITTNVTVENQGTSVETFNLTLHASYESFEDSVQYNSGNLTILNSTITDLEPGSTTTVTLEWSVFPWRHEIWPPPWSSPWYTIYRGNFTIRVEADPVPGEVDSSDNLYIDGSFIALWMVTDFDGNGKVDIRDLAMVAILFGATRESSKWNPDFDVYQDGKIDMRDLAPIARAYGTVYG